MESILYDQLSAAINHTLPYLSLVRSFNLFLSLSAPPPPSAVPLFFPPLPPASSPRFALSFPILSVRPCDWGHAGGVFDEALSKPTNPDYISHMCFTTLPLKRSRSSQGSTAGDWRFIASV